MCCVWVFTCVFCCCLCRVLCVCFFAFLGFLGFFSFFFFAFFSTLCLFMWRAFGGVGAEMRGSAFSFSLFFVCIWRRGWGVLIFMPFTLSGVFFSPFLPRGIYWVCLGSGAFPLFPPLLCPLSSPCLLFSFFFFLFFLFSARFFSLVFVCFPLYTCPTLCFGLLSFAFSLPLFFLGFSVYALHFLFFGLVFGGLGALLFYGFLIWYYVSGVLLSSCLQRLLGPCWLYLAQSSVLLDASGWGPWTSFVSIVFTCVFGFHAAFYSLISCTSSLFQKLTLLLFVCIHYTWGVSGWVWVSQSVLCLLFVAPISVPSL